MEISKTDYLKLAYFHPVKFGHWLGFDDLTDLHNLWLKDMIFEEQDKTILAHRGSFKTTCLVIALALLMVLFPNVTIIFFRKTDNDVVEVVNQVQKALLSDVFQHFVFALYGRRLVLVRANSSEIDTNLRTSSRGASQLRGLGIKTSITGKHADIVITDDIVNIDDRVSKAERDRIKQQYQELQNIKNRGGRFFNTGTPWHRDDAIATLMPNITRYTCYDTGLIDKEQIQHLRDSMTPSLFAANYELQHIADADALFKNPKYTDDYSALWNGTMQIDASYGGADGTAVTIAKEQSDGTLVLFGKRWNKHVDDCVTEIRELHSLYRAGTIYLETNGDKGYLSKNLSALNLPTSTYHENQNKFIKISTYLRQYWSKMEWFDQTDPEYMNEILDYTENAEHDDAPDSAASLIRQMKGKGQWSF